MDKFLLEFKEIQQHENPVFFSWNKALDYLNFSQSNPWRKFALFFINSLKDLQSSPNAYHNQIHSAEAIFSSALLIKEELSEAEVLHYAPYLLFAMMCHDIEHTGGHNQTPYELEKLAVNSVKQQLKSIFVQTYWEDNFLQQYGSLLHFQRKIERIILGTDFKFGVQKNIKAYQNNSSNNIFIRLNTLANEADIFVSIMDELGNEKGLLLAQEQKQPQLATQQGRLFFLENLVHYVSIASQKLAIQDYLKNQIHYLKTI